MPLLFFDILGLSDWQAQSMRDILRNMIATNGEHHGVPNIAIHINCEVSCSAADVANCYAHLSFLLGQYNFSGSKRIQHKALDLNSGGADALPQIVHRCGGGCDDMHFHLETIAMHSNRSADALLAVHAKAALDDMNDLSVVWNRNRARL